MAIIGAEWRWVSYQRVESGCLSALPSELDKANRLRIYMYFVGQCPLLFLMGPEQRRMWCVDVCSRLGGTTPM